MLIRQHGLGNKHCYVDVSSSALQNVRSPMSDRLVQHIQWHLEWNYQLIEEWVDWLAGKEYVPH